MYHFQYHFVGVLIENVAFLHIDVFYFDCHDVDHLVQAAIDNLEAMLDPSLGVDAVLIGPHDLSCNLGRTMQGIKCTMPPLGFLRALPFRCARAVFPPKVQGGGQDDFQESQSCWSWCQYPSDWEVFSIEKIISTSRHDDHES